MHKVNTGISGVAITLMTVLSGILPVVADDSVNPSAVHHDPETVLAYQGSAVLTQEAIDAAFSRIPEQNRLMFIRDGGKVDHMVRNLLQTQIIATDAEKAGFDQDPVVRERVLQAVRKELAEAWLIALVKNAPPADYAALAEEDYLAHPETYKKEKILKVSHILIDVKERSEDEALARARSVHAMLEEDPSRFEALVREYSDDPAKATNAGQYQSMRRGQMVKPFENAAFALEEPGQITAPVKTEFGFHIIRLDAQSAGELPAFEAVREQAIALAETKYLDQYRDLYLQKLFLDPIVFPDGAVQVMARRYFGEDFEKAPVFKEQDSE